MKGRFALILMGAAVLFAAAPRVPRAALTNLERHLDKRIETFDINEPLDVLGLTRAIYLEGYGVVFTGEVGLALTPGITPFNPRIPKEQVAKLRQRKLERTPQLKRVMRDMLIHSGNSLTAMPMEEQVIVSMILSYAQWEDRTGLPSEIRMQAQRKALVEYEAGRLNAAGLEAAIKVQEF